MPNVFLLYLLNKLINLAIEYISVEFKVINNVIIITVVHIINL